MVMKVSPQKKHNYEFEMVEIPEGALNLHISHHAPNTGSQDMITKKSSLMQQLCLQIMNRR